MVEFSSIMQDQLEGGEGKDKINKVDDLLFNCKENQVEELVSIRSQAIRELPQNLDFEETLIIQNSIVKWDKDGDKNNSYFHNILKGRIMRNFIGYLNKDD